MLEHLDDVDHVAGGNFQQVQGGDERFELRLAGVAADVEGDGFVDRLIADLDEPVLVHDGDGADFDVGADDENALPLVDDDTGIDLRWREARVVKQRGGEQRRGCLCSWAES